MTKDERINFRLGPELLQALRAYGGQFERSDADTIRQALWEYLASRGHGPVTKKGVKKKKKTRTRA